MIAPKKVGPFYINSAQDAGEHTPQIRIKKVTRTRCCGYEKQTATHVVEKCPNMASTKRYEKITQSYDTLGAMDEILGHTNLENAYRTSNTPSLFTMNLILVKVSLSFQMTFMYNLHLNIILYYYTILYNCYKCCTKATLNNNNNSHINNSHSQFLGQFMPNTTACHFVESKFFEIILN